MGVNIQFSQSYHWLNSWVLANIIQLSTQDFCDHFVDYRIDPGRRLYDQMVMAARCGVSYLHDAAKHILAQKSKFDLWLKNENSEIAANALLLLCVKVNGMLQSQLKKLLETFRQTGGFSENMTVERLEARKVQASQEGAPKCPLCGKPMLKRTQKHGQSQGREFWGCSDYPKCTGTRPMDYHKSSC